MGSDSRYTSLLSRGLHNVVYRIGLVPTGPMGRGSFGGPSVGEVVRFGRELVGGKVGTAIHEALKTSVSTSYKRLEQGMGRRVTYRGLRWG